ncbi:hypothetical protein E3N88_09292 [Mikania micrantha]|uniref:Uncharacterized protein n=1 Tax=Mikania micrantha TaxID=192012 RepID=A0A5N6PKV4_9ASTR|nr:hypothetical protein E3N88_09292 [Mikania micrantha]
MPAVCGPHLQTSFADEVDQTPARRAFGGVCFLINLKTLPNPTVGLFPVDSAPPPTPPSTSAPPQPPLISKPRVRSPMAASDDFSAQPLHLRRRRRGQRRWEVGGVALAVGMSARKKKRLWKEEEVGRPQEEFGPRLRQEEAA